MPCFASENQTYTGTVIFGIESLKSLKGQENLLLKKSRLENVWFLSKYNIQGTNKMAFKRTVTLCKFLISHHQIWCAHAIVAQQMHACACKMPSCCIPVNLSIVLLLLFYFFFFDITSFFLLYNLYKLI